MTDSIELVLLNAQKYVDSWILCVMWWWHSVYKCAALTGCCGLYFWWICSVPPLNIINQKHDKKQDLNWTDLNPRNCLTGCSLLISNTLQSRQTCSAFLLASAVIFHGSCDLFCGPCDLCGSRMILSLSCRVNIWLLSEDSSSCVQWNTEALIWNITEQSRAAAGEPVW